MDSTARTEPEVCSAPEDVTLEQRLAQGPLPVAATIRIATEVAASLRDLQKCGLKYGVIQAQAILLAPEGAVLRPSQDRRRLAGIADDTAGIGAVLQQMLEGAEPADESAKALYNDAVTLAERCQCELLDIRRMLIELRILGMRVRQCEAARKGHFPAAPAAAEEASVAPGGTLWRMKSLADTAAQAVLAVFTGALVKTT